MIETVCFKPSFVLSRSCDACGSGLRLMSKNQPDLCSNSSSCSWRRRKTEGKRTWGMLCLPPKPTSTGSPGTVFADALATAVTLSITKPNRQQSSAGLWPLSRNSRIIPRNLLEPRRIYPPTVTHTVIFDIKNSSMHRFLLFCVSLVWALT